MLLMAISAIHTYRHLWLYQYQPIIPSIVWPRIKTIVAGCSSTNLIWIWRHHSKDSFKKKTAEMVANIGDSPCMYNHTLHKNWYVYYNIYIYYTSQIESIYIVYPSWYGCSSPKSQFLSLDLPATMVATEIFPRPNSLMQRKRTMLWGVPHFRRIAKSQ